MNTPRTDADPTDFQKALKVCSKNLLEEIGHLGRENAELREEIAQLDKRIAEEAEYADETHARNEALVEQIAKLKDENAALSEELKAQCVVNGKGGSREAKLLAELDKLRNENAALREDKERLDWLHRGIQFGGDDGLWGFPDQWTVFEKDWSQPIGEGTTLRAAIDAARKEAQP